MSRPRYLRLADTVQSAIQSGALSPGARLPTHRAFAEKTGVALATATRVYAELEQRGLVVGEPGRGTYVRDAGVSPTLGLRQTDPEGLVDLVFNMPGGDGDGEMLRAGLRRLANAGDIEALLRYQPHAGRQHERRIMAAHLSSSLGPVSADDLLITSGGQHGLASVAFGLLRRGDTVAVDPLTYPGFRSAAALAGLELIPVEGKTGVMAPDALEKLCSSRRLKAVYLMPTVQNPLGSVMDAETRAHLVAIARRHDLLLIEDAAYAFLEADPPPSLRALAPERVIHIGGFSKSLATGLRLGYVIAPAPWHDALLEVIRATTWNAPAIISGLVTGWIEDGTLAQSEEARRRDGAARQRIARQALDGLPLLAHPNAGFAWLPLTQGIRAEPIIAALGRHGVSVSGAEAFATTGSTPQALRLAFGGVPISGLGAILQKVGDAVRATSL